MGHLFDAGESADAQLNNNLGHLVDAGKPKDAPLEDNGLAIASRKGDEEPTRGDDHVQINHDADGHAIVNHEVRQCCRGAITHTDGDTSSRKGLQTKSRAEYPWTAPRVLARYLALRMQTTKPQVWSIDDYDVMESWEEDNKEPPIEFRRDTNMNKNQYHKLMHELYQCENETDNLLVEWKTNGSNDKQIAEWKRIQDGVQRACVDMYQEVEVNVRIGEINNEKKEAHQLQMFEKGRKAKRNRQPVEEKSSDDEREDQLVCNMTGAGWESLRFPIIIDSGVCASVMPTAWCDHVPLKETSQSKAGEFFRAENGQKIHNHGERVVSMMIREGGHERHALYRVRCLESIWLRVANVQGGAQSCVQPTLGP